MQVELYTIGHSTHSLDAFLGLLARHRITALADVRRFPGSRKHPHFGRDVLAPALAGAGVEYRWFEALGGRRRDSGEGGNAGLRNASFRAYAGYAATHEFRQAVEELLRFARRRRTTLMCAEALYWRCHRRLIADFLLARGVAVLHVMPDGRLRPHTLTDGARVEGGVLTYPAPEAGRA